MAIAILIFMMWRLYQAKQYNKFIDWLNGPIKDQVAAHLKDYLIAQRCELLPNNDTHIQAATLFYMQYPVRIFQQAVKLGIIDKQWFYIKKNKRFAAHLYAIQAPYKISTIQYTEIIEQELALYQSA